MCVSLPAKVDSISGRIAQVEVSGLKRQVVLVADNVQPGDWVLIYGGAVLAVLDEATALESLGLIRSLKP